MVLDLRLEGDLVQDWAAVATGGAEQHAVAPDLVAEQQCQDQGSEEWHMESTSRTRSSFAHEEVTWYV